MESIKLINEIVSATSTRLGRPLLYATVTFGCQMNVRESEKLSGVIEAMGYERAADEREADLILYNTCCVRENAENKIFGNLSYLKYQKQFNPDLIVAVCGCMVQQPGIFSLIEQKHGYIDVVFGTANHAMFPKLLLRRLDTGKPARDISGKDAPPKVSPDETSERGAGVLTARGHGYKAGVNVMYGCNNFCSYCVVPYVRGRERSRMPADVLNEVRALACDGVKEIMLLGQNVNSYGAGFDEPVSFARLLRQVNEVEGLRRIRFMTSHPKDFSDELITAVRDCGNVCKQVHLPLQSGSSRVLADMNRRYTKERYIELTEKLRAAIPGVALSTDIIVGYPGETEEDFAETLDVVRRVRFNGAFTFIYSKRTGTPAARRGDAVPREAATERFNRLTGAINPILLAYNEAKLGTLMPVMLEEGKSRLGIRSRAEDNTLVHVSVPEGVEVKPGDIIDVRITEAKTFYLTGVPAKNIYYSQLT
jgi:tRNA-2-methylthio-N6-dimethylallyladenosine synthase